MHAGAVVQAQHSRLSARRLRREYNIFTAAVAGRDCVDRRARTTARPNGEVGARRTRIASRRTYLRRRAERERHVAGVNEVTDLLRRAQARRGIREAQTARLYFGRAGLRESKALQHGGMPTCAVVDGERGHEVSGRTGLELHTDIAVVVGLERIVG